MQFDDPKGTLVAVWGLAISVAIVAAHRSVSTSALLAAFATFPPLVMLRWWNDPHRTLSQSIPAGCRS